MSNSESSQPISERSVYRQVLPMIPSSWLSAGVALIDYKSVTMISSSALAIHSICILFPMILEAFGKCIGHPFLVAHAKGLESEKARLAASTIGFSFISSIAFGLILYPLAIQYVQAVLGSAASAGWVYFHLLYLSGMLMMLQIGMSYVLIAMRHSRAAMIRCVVEFILNLIINVGAVKFLASAEYQLIGVGLGTLAATLYANFSLWRRIRQTLDLEFKDFSPWIYWTRCRTMLIGQTVSVAATALAPLAVMALLYRLGAEGHQLAVLYGALLPLAHWLTIPIYATLGGGIMFYAEGKAKSADLKMFWRATQNIQWVFSLIPCILAMIFIESLIRIYVGSQLSFWQAVLCIAILAKVPVYSLCTRALFELRFQERHRLLSLFDGGTQLLSCLIILAAGILSDPWLSILVAHAFAISLPIYLFGLPTFAIKDNRLAIR